VNIELKKVTPAMAEKWLKKNHPKNRRISQAIVDAIAGDIANGNWKITHQGICFDGDGCLIDGQHRLNAIVQAGKTVEILVAENSGSEIGDPIDTHRKRTTSYLTGYTTKTIAACKVLRGFVDGYQFTTNMTAAQSTAVYELFADDLAALAPVPGRDKLFGGIIAALVWAVPVSDRVVEFAAQVSRGEMLKRGDPAFALRGWLEANRRALQPWDSALACLNCVTHFLCNKEQRSVYSGEAGYRFVTTKRRTLKLPNTPGADIVITLTKPGFEK
jgi:hypothetical protein